MKRSDQSEPDPDTLLVPPVCFELGAPRWSPNGEWVVYVSRPDSESPFALWAQRHGTNAPPVLLAEHAGSLGSPSFSPDGKYVAYLQGDAEDGGAPFSEVWVVAFPDPTEGRWRISTGPMSWIQWSHDGESIFTLEWTVLLHESGMIKAIPVERDPEFTWGRAEDFFDASYYEDYLDVGPDDRSFLLSTNHWFNQAAGEKRYVMIRSTVELLKEKGGG
jgi:dipeptidyl aminopeptidase/acylaminoacyl peptidase